MTHAIIMAGGSGTRFWPMSREKHPKQVLKIISDNTMIEETVERLNPLIMEDDIHIVTNKELGSAMKKVLPDVSYVIEPEPKSTAAAIGLSAITIMEKDPDATIFVETADHYYENVPKYHGHISAAVSAAEQGSVVLIGIKPRYAHPGLGYIQKDGELFESEGKKVFKIAEFKEKPDVMTAQKYVDSGEYLWNSGMFIAKANVMLAAIKKHMPKLHSALIAIKESGFDEKKIASEFAKLDSVSIDYGVMEKSDDIAVIEADMHWDDIGDWQAMDRVFQHDDDGNVIKANWKGKAKNCIIMSDTARQIETERIEDLAIIDTPDCLLVVNKDRSQEVKELVDRMLQDKDYKDYVKDYVSRPKKRHIKDETFDCNVKNDMIVATIGVSGLDIEQTSSKIIVRGLK